jgi:hypothetical protein
MIRALTSALLLMTLASCSDPADSDPGGAADEARADAASTDQTALTVRGLANEAIAITTLRNLVAAQTHFQILGAIDVDLDGTGEHGAFGEMSGVVALNQRAGGNSPAVRLNQPILGDSFRNIDANGYVTKSGYLFRIFLPDSAGKGQPEGAAGAPNRVWDSDRCEASWLAYAWPVDGKTGTRAFMIDQRGELLQTNMRTVQYNEKAAPSWTAAYAAGPANMGGSLATDDPGGRGDDGNMWTPVR